MAAIGGAVDVWKSAVDDYIKLCTVGKGEKLEVVTKEGVARLEHSYGNSGSYSGWLVQATQRKWSNLLGGKADHLSLAKHLKELNVHLIGGAVVAKHEIEHTMVNTVDSIARVNAAAEKILQCEEMVPLAQAKLLDMHTAYANDKPMADAVNEVIEGLVQVQNVVSELFASTLKWQPHSVPVGEWLENKKLERSKLVTVKTGLL